MPFETVEPGSVTPAPRGSGSPSATTGLGDAAGHAAHAVSITQARSKALSVVGGGRVTKVEAETEHGRAVWEIEVVYKGVEHDLDIDRRTGAVTDHDIDRDDRVRDDDRGRDDRGRGGDDRGHDDRVRGGDDRGGDDRGRGGDDDRSGRHGGDDKGRHGDDDRGGRHGGDDD
ncbi:hypothetical protein Aab01nite_08250 [Paractinoplanes abujensis]|nr:hypothetical protein Aab01nite_08250 [Actinoplanes abujensis]